MFKIKLANFLKGYLVFGLFLTVLSQQAFADVQQFLDGVYPDSSYSGTRDAYLQETRPNDEFGTLTTLRADGESTENGQTGEYVSVIKWDVSSIPSNAIINSVSIRFDVSNSSSGTYNVYKVNNSWTEVEVDWNDIPGASGGSGTTVLGSFNPSTTGLRSFSLNSSGIQVVQDWVSGASTNDGIMIRSGGTTDGVVFGSREASPSDRPRLTIDFTVPPPDENNIVEFLDGVHPDSSYSGTQDSYLRETQPTTEFGNQTIISADGSDTSGGQTGELVGIIKWDISSIPSSAVVNSVSLRFDITNVSPGAYDLYAVNTSWTEAGANWSNVIGAGGAGSTILGSFTPSSTGLQSINLNSAGVQVVQGWVNNSSTNNGFLIRTAGTNNGVDFWSSEASVSDRPKLTIDYDSSGGGGGTPEDFTVNFSDGTHPNSSYNGTRDAYIRETQPNDEFGTESILRADGSDTSGGQTGELASVIKWDMSSIPTDSVVTSVSIRFDVSNQSPGAYNLYQVNLPWTEIEIDWNDIIGTSGGAGTTVLGSFTPSSTGLNNFTLNNSGIQVVQGWVNNPSSNNGFLIRSAGTNDGVTFWSREGNVADRPRITINYSSSGGGGGGSGPDTTPPVVTAPPDVTANSTGTLTQVNIGTATATDNVEVASITNNAPSGGYPLGTTVVTWTATDTSGNTGTDTQSVTVIDGPTSSTTEYFVNVKDFGATGNGVTNDRPAIQAAIDSLYTNSIGGGTVYFPPGTYRIFATSGSGDIYQGGVMRNGILLRDENGSSEHPYENNRINRITLRGAGKSSVLIGSGDTRMFIIRIATSYVTIKDLYIRGGIDYKTFGRRVIGIGIVPENMGSSSTPAHLSYNVIDNVTVTDSQEGVLMMCGPGVSGSHCGHNMFNNLSLRLMTRGIYMASGVQGSLGNSANVIRNAGFNFMNVGLHIESGDHNTCFHCSINDIELTESPYNGGVPKQTATSVVIEDLDKWNLWANVNNRIYNLPSEHNSRDIENESSTTEIYGASGVSLGKTKWTEPPQFMTSTKGSYVNNSSVIIGDSGFGTPHPNVILGVYSTSKGFLPPGLFATQISGMGTSSLPEGLVIFNRSTGNLQVFDGNQWRVQALE